VGGNQRKLLRPRNVSMDINMNRLQEMVLEDALQISGIDREGYYRHRQKLKRENGRTGLWAPAVGS
jgi:hypothetical protein